jgi:hypothetical protein
MTTATHNAAPSVSPAAPSIAGRAVPQGRSKRGITITSPKASREAEIAKASVAAQALGLTQKEFEALQRKAEQDAKLEAEILAVEARQHKAAKAAAHDAAMQANLEARRAKAQAEAAGVEPEAEPDEAAEPVRPEAPAAAKSEPKPEPCDCGEFTFRAGGETGRALPKSALLKDPSAKELFDGATVVVYRGAKRLGHLSHTEFRALAQSKSRMSRRFGVKLSGAQRKAEAAKTRDFEPAKEEPRTFKPAAPFGETGRFRCLPLDAAAKKAGKTTTAVSDWKDLPACSHVAIFKGGKRVDYYTRENFNIHEQAEVPAPEPKAVKAGKAAPRVRPALALHFRGASYSATSGSYRAKSDSPMTRDFGAMSGQTNVVIYRGNGKAPVKVEGFAGGTYAEALAWLEANAKRDGETAGQWEK